ncbi:MAG: argininosuccinate lyase [Verrucomicrobia bacterium]|nr:argininosuccinate lyase [Verrucomicrobiota bacterium]
MATRPRPISRSGRFRGGPDADARRFSESVSFDRRLYRQDIAGSIAHATMLAQVGVLTRRERNQIVRGLKRIEREIKNGRFQWKEELEDVHMNIEAALTKRIPAAARLHTARSRNDQVATDMRLWVKDEVRSLKLEIRNLQQALVDLAERTRLTASHRPVILNSQLSIFNLSLLPLPGYTHLQRAQPVFAAHHLLAYVEMLQRDAERFADCAWRTDICPLGSGALAGTGIRIDRKLTAKLLGFRESSANSMDAVSDRDFAAEFLFAAALTGVHLSRMAEDFILWSSAEFGFITIADSHTTGSSLMPQKKNPDVVELARGKSGRLIGNLISLLVVLKGLPMTYNRDLQEDKEPLFDSADTLSAALPVLAGMVRATAFNVETCLRAVRDPTLLATELADHLVRRGVPFREAHHAVGAAVRHAEDRRKPLNALTVKEWRDIHPKFGKDVSGSLRLENAFRSRDHLAGSPSPRYVESQLQGWKNRLKRPIP